MRFEIIHFALVGGTHCTPGAVHYRTDIHTRLALVFDEFAKARLEYALHAAGRMPRAGRTLKQGVEIGSLPENILEFITLPYGLPDGEQFAKDEPPGHEGSHQQQRHHQLHRQAGTPDKMEKR